MCLYSVLIFLRNCEYCEEQVYGMLQQWFYESVSDKWFMMHFNFNTNKVDSSGGNLRFRRRGFNVFE